MGFDERFELFEPVGLDIIQVAAGLLSFAHDWLYCAVIARNMTYPSSSGSASRLFCKR